MLALNIDPSRPDAPTATDLAALRCPAIRWPVSRLDQPRDFERFTQAGIQLWPVIITLTTHVDAMHAKEQNLPIIVRMVP